MSRRRTPPKALTEGFFFAACTRHGRVDWLRRFDEAPGVANGRLEATHLISRQRIRSFLRPQLIDLATGQPIEGLSREDVEDLVELAEWDPRNAGGLAYTSRHRRFDHHATPELRVPAEALPADFLEFVDDLGLEVEACRRFDHYDTAVLGAGPRPSGRSAPVSTEQGDEARAA